MVERRLKEQSGAFDTCLPAADSCVPTDTRQSPADEGAVGGVLTRVPEAGRLTSLNRSFDSKSQVIRVNLY